MTRDDTSMKIHLLVAATIAACTISTPAGAAPQSTNTTNTVKTAVLDDFAAKVLAELNLARTKPQEFLKYVKEHRASFKNGTQFKGPNGLFISTKEGTAVVDETIAFLSKVKPVPALSASKGLSLAAKDHVDDLGPKGKIGHTGTDGSSVEDRINRHGKWEKTIGENIAMGPRDAHFIVMQLIIDDGVPDRGHRTNIYNGDFLTVGIDTGIHKQYGSMCVMDFAGGFKDGVAAPKKSSANKKK